jgi:hypothetical protein
LLAFNAVFMALVWGCALLILIPLGSPPHEVLALAPYTIALALVLGFGMTIIYRVSARWMELPAWE